MPGPGLWGFTFTGEPDPLGHPGSQRCSCLPPTEDETGDGGSGQCVQISGLRGDRSRIQTQHGCSDPHTKVPLLGKGHGLPSHTPTLLTNTLKAFPSSGKRLQST